MDASDLKSRTMQFALRIIKLVRAISPSVEGRAIANQLVRCGTAVGANYRAACKARSRAEFIAKIGVVEEEADESAFWLELIVNAGILSQSAVVPLLDEATQISKIVGRSRITAQSRAKSPPVSKPIPSNRQSAIGIRQSIANKEENNV